MERRLYTYALIRSLYDQGKDYLDAFWPFIIKVIPTDKSVNLKYIHDKVKQDFDIGIPLYVLQTILNRAKRKGYIKLDKKHYALSSKGVEFREKIETEREVERRINCLLNDLCIFFNERGKESIDRNQAYELLISFINENIEPLIVKFPMLSTQTSLSPIKKSKNKKDF